MNIVDLLVLSGIVPSKGEARRLIQQGGLAVNGKKVEDISLSVAREALDRAGGCLIRKGKKHYYRIVFSE